MNFFEEEAEKNQISDEDKIQLEVMIIDKNDYYEVKNAIEYYFLHLKPRMTEI